jgi:hypothetical protein
MVKIKLLISLIFIFCSCNVKNTNENNDLESAIKIDLLSESSLWIKRLSEFTENIEYIPLQTVESSLISDNVGKIVKKAERIYIQNRILNRGEILCFNIDGKFLFKIEKSGRGPEEYTNIEDFDVSSDNKFVMILPSLIHKLLLYGISDTDFYFQRSITLKDPSPYRISLIPETNHAFLAIPPWRGTEITLSLLINIAGDTIHYKPNIYKYEMVRKINFRAKNETLVYTFGDMVCFKEIFSDTIFCIDANENLFKTHMILNSYGL